MRIDKHVTLFQSTRLKENAKAVDLIKTMLVDFKDNNFSFNYALKNIVEHFCNLETEHITSRSNLIFLLNIFQNERGKFEDGKSLLVIPKLLKPKFDEMEGLDISFDEYVTHLANRISFSRARVKFQANLILFEAMYKIGKFEGHEHLPKFDVRMFRSEHNYYKLEEEIFKLAYPMSNIEKQQDNQKDNKQIRSTKVFNFSRDSIDHLKSEIFFSTLTRYNYFGDDVTFEDYKKVFFEDPNSHKTTIQLGCETTLFASLLDQLKKKKIALKISYTEIENHKLFLTINGTYLSRANISNSIRSISKANLQEAQSTIESIEKAR